MGWRLIENAKSNIWSLYLGRIVGAFRICRNFSLFCRLKLLFSSKIRLTGLVILVNPRYSANKEDFKLFLKVRKDYWYVYGFAYNNSQYLWLARGRLIKIKSNDMERLQHNASNILLISSYDFSSAEVENY